jgi:isoquinoline 1-oxidoreductase beta subunit
MIVNDDGSLTLASVGEFAPVRDEASVNDRIEELSRRQFLKLSGGIGGGLMLALHLRPLMAQAPVTGDPAPAFVANAFIRIDPDDSILIYAKSPEIGQGIKTVFPMIIAEELDADWARVRIEQAPIRPDLYGSQGAGGSRSVAANWTPLRQTGAVARAMLISAAAQRWQVPVSECHTEPSVVVHAPSGRKLRYGELAADAARLPMPDMATVVLKDKREFRILGRSVNGVDNPKIVTGAPLFGIDTQLEGLSYAVYQKAPAFNATCAECNLDHIKTLPGVKDAFVSAGDPRVDAPPGIAIIATSTWAAFSAKKQLQVKWNESPATNDSWTGFVARAKQLVKRPQGENSIAKVGDVDAASAEAAHTLDAFYQFSFVAHAPLEPQNTTAWMHDGILEMWCPSQNPDTGRNKIARAFGLPHEKVVVHQTRVGGGFGRRLMTDYMGEAAVIARRFNGPVKLMWTREDDMMHDYYRPGGFHRLRASIDRQGRLSAWQDHNITFTADGQKPVFGAGASAQEFPALLVKNVQVSQSLLPLGTRCGFWRAPNSSSHAFVVQSFLHELSVAAKRDHVEFLLEIMGEPRWLSPGDVRSLNTGRAAGVIKLAAERGGWGRKMPAGRALGLAFHFSHAGHFAEVAEVSVDSRKKIKVHRVTVVGDVGPILNPRNAEHQCIGCVTDGLSAMMALEVTMEQGKIAQSNFDAYPLLRNADAPEVDVHFIESDHAPTGLGEPALPPLAPAVCNAIFTVTGHRIRTLPIRNEGFSI